MTAHLAPIVARAKPMPAHVAAPDDFAAGPAADVDPAIVLTEPGWSLYALDLDTETAVFVEMPPGFDLASAPFVYAAQFDTARRMVTIPIDTALALARGLPAPRAPGLVFSTGRCGSTLVSRILALVPGVASLSEPDALTNLAFARDRIAPPRMAALIDAALRFLAHAAGPHDRLVIKPRSEAVVHAADYAGALPGARCLFLYRDALGYVNSLYRFAQRNMGGTRFHQQQDEALRLAWPLATVNAAPALRHKYFGAGGPEMDMLGLMALGWLLRIQGHHRAQAAGMRLTPLHYDDLNADRRDRTAGLLAALGLDTGALDAALTAFDRDAHEGTIGANDVPATPLDGAQRGRVARMLAGWGQDPLDSARLPETGTA